MNLPTLIILVLVAAAIFLALWLPRRNGRKLTDCGSCSACSKAGSCKVCIGSVKDPAAVEETEAGGFKEMGGQDVRFTRQVGNRPGDLEDAGIGAG